MMLPDQGMQMQRRMPAPMGSQQAQMDTPQPTSPTGPQQPSGDASMAPGPAAMAPDPMTGQAPTPPPSTGGPRPTAPGIASSSPPAMPPQDSGSNVVAHHEALPGAMPAPMPQQQGSTQANAAQPMQQPMMNRGNAMRRPMYSGFGGGGGARWQQGRPDMMPAPMGSARPQMPARRPTPMGS